MHMATKTVSLREEAYRRLKALKTGEKSFSDVVMDLTQKKNSKFEELRDMNIDMTVEELIKGRREEDFIDEEREKLLR